MGNSIDGNNMSMWHNTYRMYLYYNYLEIVFFYSKLETQLYILENMSLGMKHNTETLKRFAHRYQDI